MNVEQVYNIIVSAASPGARQQEAMNTLQSLEEVTGFATSLLSIIPASSNASGDSRLLTVILLKNIIHKRWVPRGGKLLPLEIDEKVRIKQFLLEYAPNEIDSRISVQLALIAAKVARNDWPDQWPELFPAIFSSLQSAAALIRSRSASILLEVLAELSTKTLSFAKSSFGSLCEEMFPEVLKLWTSQRAEASALLAAFNPLAQTDTNLTQNIVFHFEHWQALSEILKRVLTTSFPSIASRPSAGEYFTSLAESLQTIAAFVREARSHLSRAGVTLEQIEDPLVDRLRDSLRGVTCSARRFLDATFKQFAQLQKMYPLDAVPYLEPFLVFYLDQLAAECRQSVDKIVAIPAIQLLNNVLSCEVYVSNEALSPSKKSVNVSKIAKKLVLGAGGLTEEEEKLDAMAGGRGALIKQRFFSDSRALQILELCLGQLLQVTSLDLSEWAEDPEQYFVGLSGLTDADSVKAAAEHLFLSLLEHNSFEVLNYVMRLLRDVSRQLAAVSAASSSLETDTEIRFWDAVYTMAGLGASLLSQHIHASEWFSTGLSLVLQEVSVHPSRGALSSGQQILRARLVWMLNCWHASWDGPVLAAMAGFCVSLLDSSSGSDVVVRMNVLSNLSNIFHSELFALDSLLPSLQRLLENLCNFIGDLDMNENKAQVVNVVGDIAMTMGSQLQGLLLPLAEYLAKICKSSGQQSMLSASIHEVMEIVVKMARATSPALHPVVLPLIHDAIVGVSGASSAPLSEGGDEDDQESYLLQSGISLWLSVVRNYPPSSGYYPSLDQLLKDGLGVLFRDHGSAADLQVNALQDILMVVEGYAVIGGLSCLQSCFASLMSMYQKILGQVARRLVPYVTRPIEAFFLSCPTETTTFIVQTGALHRMLQSCCFFIPGLELVMKEYEESETAVVSYLSVIARVMVSGGGALTTVARTLVEELIIKGAAPAGTGVDVLLRSLAKLFVNFFDTVSSFSAGMWRRKLWCLALLTLYPNNDPELLALLPELVTMIDGVLCEEQSEEGAGRLTLIVAASMTALEDDIDTRLSNEAEPIVDAMKTLVENDVVARSSLLTIAREKIQQVRSTVGDKTCGQLLHDTAPSALAKLLG